MPCQIDPAVAPDVIYAFTPAGEEGPEGSEGEAFDVDIKLCSVAGGYCDQALDSTLYLLLLLLLLVSTLFRTRSLLLVGQTQSVS